MRSNPDHSIPLFAVIAGGAGTLGAAIAEQLSSRGYRIAIADKDKDRGQALVERLINNGGNSEFILLDVTKNASWMELREHLQCKSKNLDLFVSAAGDLAVGDFDRLAIETHAEIVTVNLQGTLNGCHALISWMAANPNGSHMVLVASCAGFLTMPWSGSYNASKAGVIALGETLSAEYGPKIAVTVACPAFFPSELFPRATIADRALGRLVRRLTEKGGLTSIQLAQRICRAIEKRKSYVVLPRRTYWLWWLKRLFPSWYTKRLGQEAKRYRAKSQAIIDENQ